MARHSHPGGRFDVTWWEQKSIYDGIDSELRAPIGHHVLWVEYAPASTEVDRIYDVADHEEVGRQWKFPPTRIPAFSAFIYQGPSPHNDRGFYNTDILRLSVAMNVIQELFPSLVWNPDEHIKDRILYRGRVFIPTRNYLRGLLRDNYTVFTMDANEVKEEEYVNDPQLTEWAQRTLYPPQPFDPQMQRRHSTL
jgi:hypothetical protein